MCVLGAALAIAAYGCTRMYDWIKQKKAERAAELLRRGAERVAKEALANLTPAQQASVKKINNVITNNLTPSDFSAVLRELQGNPISRPGGGVWDHITEMVQSHVALSRALDSIAGSLRNPNLTQAAREFLQSQFDLATSYVEQIERLFSNFGGITEWLP